MAIELVTLETMFPAYIVLVLIIASETIDPRGDAYLRTWFQQLSHREWPIGVWPPKHAERDARSPHIVSTHVCILDAIHQFDAMACNVIVETCVSRLIDISSAHTDRSLVPSLSQQAIVFVCKCQLVASRKLKLLCEKQTGLDIDSDRVTIFTSSSQLRFGD
jgi:hypothetical protein